MKKVVALFTLLVFAFSAQSQKPVYPEKYWLEFTDKNHSTYSLSQPQEFLSERALERRQRYGISLSTRDLPVSRFYLDSLKALGLTVLNPSKWLNGVVVQSTDTLLLDTLHTLGFVKDNRTKKTKKERSRAHNQKQNYDFFQPRTIPQTFYRTFDYGRSENQVEMLNGHVLHNLGFRGEGMVIAVIDAGFYRANELPAFDSLWANQQILGSRDFVKGDTINFGGSNHGMKALSTIGGNVPGLLVGTAPKAFFWLLRSEDSHSEHLIEEYNWATAAEFADSVGADLINTSLGYSVFDDKTASHTYADMDGNTTPVTRAADVAAQAGMLVVVSAGNEGGWSPWKYITAPADADSVLTVGAVDAQGDYAYFSSVGPSFDRRIKPDVTAKGQMTTVQGSYGRISSASGTSFSAPITTGMMACLWQAHPELSNMQIIEAARKTASQAQNPDSLKGYGIPDFATAHLYLSLVEQEHFAKTHTIKTFPNPFRSFLSVEIFSDTQQSFNVQILNLFGQVMLKKEVELNGLDFKHIQLTQLNSLTNGIYILRVESENRVVQKKIIKQ